MNTSIILNAAFRGNTEAHSVKNHDEAYIAVWNPWGQRHNNYFLFLVYNLNSSESEMLVNSQKTTAPVTFPFDKFICST